MNAIEIKKVTKEFRGTTVLKDLTLTVPEGAIYGFIGDNGSGKSTTQKIICGLLQPNSGEIFLYGKPYNNSEIRGKIGALIENPGAFPNSTVYNNLMMQALNLGLKKPNEEVNRVLELVKMTGSAQHKFKHCSLGMKQRIGVAQALLGHPKLLILDEPINGLDADGMRIVREILIDLNHNHGLTVMISSHILEELSKIATHYGIIKNGKIISQIKADELNVENKNYILIKADNLSKVQKILNTEYRRIELLDDGLKIYDESDASEISKFLYQHQVFPNEISIHQLGLEEYYLDSIN